jgi:lysozyme
MHLGQYERAIADATYAIELDPSDHKALNNRGIVYSRKRQYDRAIQDYDRAIKLKPDFAQATNNRGIAYRNKRRYDRPTRADLAWRAFREDYSGPVSAPRRRAFEFPTHASEGVFGIDVSHHNEDGRWPIAWHELISQGVSFVYAKATQGRRFYDHRFERTWAEVARLQEEGQEIYRGAYHFLASNVDPVEQAENFLSAIGTLGPKDLPPCVDIEWHMAWSENGSVDLWSSFSEAQIVKKLSKFIAIVEAATGRKPLIYTARSWWRKNIPTSTRFENYPIWIADYGPHLFDPHTPVAQLEPRVMDGHQWAIWQFTDTGGARMGGLPGRVDVNIFNGSMNDFKLAFGIETLPAPLPALPSPAATPQRKSIRRF